MVQGLTLEYWHCHWCCIRNHPLSILILDMVAMNVLPPLKEQMVPYRRPGDFSRVGVASTSYFAIPAGSFRTVPRKLALE